MADPQQVNDEFGRRLAAARGYNRESIKAWAKRVGVDRNTWRHYELGQIEPERRAWAIDECRALTGLPKQFFAIDFNDLPEMVAAWRQVQDEEGRPDKLIQDLVRDEEDALPADPSGSKPGEQDPEDGDR